MKPAREHSSRHRYKRFVGDYKQRRLDALADAADGRVPAADPSAGAAPQKKEDEKQKKTTRRKYLRDYLRWLWPHRWSVAGLFLFALIAAGLEMIEPKFMQFIIDRVLLNPDLDRSTRIWWLNLAGGTFLLVIVLQSVVNIFKNYRQRLVNTRVMLSLRRALFDRLLHLPLPQLWEMKTGGILSRLTGDVDTTTGLMQSAIVSPAIAVVRLIIVIAILFTTNWRLALTVLGIIPGAMLMSFASARRIRPIYRSLRQDAEQIDGRVGETFSGIRVVRAFSREARELMQYMHGRHTVVRK
ncbi:MAG TPA: ABC transporter ATP-binding protein, partial [Vicinamibacterales bacterium]|nr:ABC transporter ATP-binding protein [Vicinamibacterales bacterium]